MWRSCSKRLAFIDYGKAAGTYIDQMLMTRVSDSDYKAISRQQWKRFNSWVEPFRLGRDWSESELLNLANFRSSFQRPSAAELEIHSAHWSHAYLSYQYVHNHDLYWSRQTVRTFRDCGWLTFMFLREPVDRLCSVYFWVQDQIKKGVDPVIVFQPSDWIYLTLDDFICAVLEDPDPSGVRRYALPDYVDDIEFVCEFSRHNFEIFLRTYLGYQGGLDGQRVNSSSNRGYEYYCENGWISVDTQHKISAHSSVAKVRERLGDLAVAACPDFGIYPGSGGE